MSNDARYIVNGDTSAAINNGATQGWLQLARGGASQIGFQVVLAATGTPVGLFHFEITDDENPLVPQGVILGATDLVLVAPYTTTPYQPSDGIAHSVQFEFGPSAPMPCPSAKWMRLRYAPASGGAASGLNVGVNQKGAR